ncbi:hypothetical protein D3C85_1568510 [compost metagenome]
MFQVVMCIQVQVFRQQAYLALELVGLAVLPSSMFTLLTMDVPKERILALR